MVYPSSIESKLDFLLLRDRLKQACSSSLGRELSDAMHFETDYTTIARLLGETAEMRTVTEDLSYSFPEGEIHDLREAIARTRIEGLYMDEQELFALLKSLTYVSALDMFFARLDKARFPYLHRSVSDAQGITMTVRLIEPLLDRYGQLRDNASPELARIRHELNLAQGSVARTIQRVMKQAQAEGWIEKDASPTLREGRFVLPVSPAFRRKMGGIVHDESATGKTVFVEPQEVVEANNRIRSLESEEKRERIRILTQTTKSIRPYSDDILQAQDRLAWVDFVRAKARLAKQLNAIAPRLNNKPMIRWYEARHALLFLRFVQEGRTVVPMSLSLNDRADAPRLLLISGPNAGGKSVCLKTVALTQYMLQCGLLVPVREDSEAGVFDHLLIDIGDEQSLQDDLSTYSSHLRNMKFFLRIAGKTTLYLIDEMGSGTEPTLGGAIAQATLSALHHDGAIGVVTTHYANLKFLAEQTEGMVNGAMLYDRGAMRPLFQLSVGQAGSSFAIEIAKQIGLPAPIIEEVTHLVGEDRIDYDRQMQDIARDRRYWENKRQHIRQKEKQLEERIASYEQEMATIKQKKKEIIAKAKNEAADLLEASNAAIERTIREIKESRADQKTTRQARQRVEKLKHRVADAPKPSLINAVPSDSKRPTVFRDFADLKGMSKSMPSQSASVQNTIRSHKLSFNRQLDLRGLRVDEAQEQLIAYMDTAIMVAAGTVSILHGTGTGAVKQVTWDYLKQLKRHNRIVDYYEGDPDHGGAGLTLVEI